MAAACIDLEIADQSGRLVKRCHDCLIDILQKSAHNVHTGFTFDANFKIILGIRPRDDVATFIMVILEACLDKFDDFLSASTGIRVVSHGRQPGNAEGMEVVSKGNELLISRLWT